MLALLCGGQGRLSAQMFDLVAEQPLAGPIFAETGALLGRDPRDLVRSGDHEAILSNRTSQILSVCAALATHACLAEVLPTEVAVAGYSVGEMAAWAIAGAWTAETSLRLTDRRARAMDAADGGAGGLGYVRGLARPAVEALARGHGCAIAIVNPERLFVVGGKREDVAALCRAAEASGGKAAPLEVRVSSHTPRLAAAVTPFQAALESSHPANPASGRLLFVGGRGTRIYQTAGAIADLAAQVARPLDWAAALEALGEAGVDRLLDLGPGHALADMARTALPQTRSYAAEAFHSLEGLRAWLAAPAGAADFDSETPGRRLQTP